MKVETPSNGAGQGTPTQPVSDALPDWSTSWPPGGETPAPTTPIPEQARVPSQGYDINPAPAATQYAPAPAPRPAAPYTPAPTPQPAYTPARVSAPRDREKESSGLIWPILLIAAGTILLLNTLGVLTWAVWSGIGRLWPLALIFIGLELLVGRRSRVASYVIAGLLVVTLISLAMVWSFVPWSSGSVVQQSISQPISGATSVDVEISLGVGNLTISPLASPGNDVMQGTIELSNNEKLQRDYTVNSGVGRLTLTNTGPDWTSFGSGDVGPRNHDIKLNPTPPMSLKIDGGVGDTTLNLAGFNMRRLEVNSGVGKVNVTLPAKGISDAYLHGGVGEMIVNVPSGTALRVNVTQGLGSSNFPSTYAQEGDVYTSPGYDTAANRVNMNVTGGVGSLTVNDVNR